MNFSASVSKKLLAVFLLLFGLVFIPASKAEPSPTPSGSSNPYTVEMKFDKQKVSNGDSTQVTITAKNTSTSAINNFEMRLPFYKTVQDIKSVNENPSFNKLLNSNEYPSGFNNRSWLINVFNPGDSKSFTISYTVDQNAKGPNGLTSSFTVPGGWNDPAGISQGQPQNSNFLRLDLYLDSSYKTSYSANLPTLELSNNKIQGIKLSDKYYFAGSKTTDFKTVTEQNISAFPNLTFDSPDVLVEWQIPVDLSSQIVIDKLKKFDDLFKPSPGKLGFNASELGFLAKSAKVTFKNLSFVNEPKVRFDGEALSLTDAKAQWFKNEKKVFVLLDNGIRSVSIAPNLIFETESFEAKETKATLKGKISDVSSVIKYQIDDNPAVTIDGLDLSTGDFEIPVENTPNVKQIKVEATSKLNNEKGEKILPVTYSPEVGTPTPSKASNPGSVSLISNPITLALLLVATAIICMIAGYVYYLYYRKNKNNDLVDDDLASPTSDVKDANSDQDVDVQEKGRLERKNSGSSGVGDTEYLKDE